MITVRLQGGLGNQMFQYALGTHLAERNNDELRLDLTFLLDRTPRKNFVFRDYDLDIFPIKPRFTALSGLAGFHIPAVPFAASHLYHKWRANSGREVFLIDPDLTFNPEVFKAKGDIYLAGYWQSEKYFKDIAPRIRREFTPADPLSPAGEELAKDIRNSEAVCVNVRRGDFVTVQRSAEAHGFVGESYYKRAMDLVAGRVGSPKVFVFSDDVEWCEKNLKFPHPTVYVSHAYKGRKFGEYLKLMTLCRHFIIPNSSFGWWAAWLAETEPRHVVAPRQWFKDSKMNSRDIVPDRWLRV